MSPVLNRFAHPVKEQVCVLEILEDPNVLLDEQVAVVDKGSLNQLQLLSQL